MVQTVKFSAFTAVDPEDTSVKYVGTGSGANVISEVPFRWTTSGRPASPYNGLIGYNTSLDQYEYWNESNGTWEQLATDTSGFNWTIITDPSVNAVVNSGYITNRTVTPVQIVLPATFAIGDRVEIMGLGAGGWSLVAGASQIIRFASSATSTAGAINSDIQYANITVGGLVANTMWSVYVTNSNPSLV